MGFFKKHPIVIYIAVWTLAYWVVMPFVVEREAPDFSLSGFLTAFAIGLIAGIAQYFIEWLITHEKLQ